MEKKTTIPEKTKCWYCNNEYIKDNEANGSCPKCGYDNPFNESESVE